MRNNLNNDNLISLQSNEFDEQDQEQNFQPNNDRTRDNGELNALINELNEDEPIKEKVKYNARNHDETTLDLPKAQENLISHDSFEDLIGEFGEIEKEDKPPGMAKVEFISKKADEFEF